MTSNGLNKMLIKCVGGQLDGQSREVDLKRYKINDILEFRQIKASCITSFNSITIPDVIVDYVDFYLLSCIRIDAEIIYFLKDKNISWIDAVKHQFTKSISEKFIETVKSLIEDWGFEYSLNTKRKDIIKLATAIGMDKIWIKEHLEI